jgi:hypothetical protein
MKVHKSLFRDIPDELKEKIRDAESMSDFMAIASELKEARRGPIKVQDPTGKVHDIPVDSGEE